MTPLINIFPLKSKDERNNKILSDDFCFVESLPALQQYISGLSQINCFVGANNAGKSRTIRALYAGIKEVGEEKEEAEIKDENLTIDKAKFPLLHLLLMSDEIKLTEKWKLFLTNLTKNTYFLLDRKNFFDFKEKENNLSELAKTKELYSALNHLNPENKNYHETLALAIFIKKHEFCKTCLIELKQKQSENNSGNIGTTYQDFFTEVKSKLEDVLNCLYRIKNFINEPKLYKKNKSYSFKLTKFNEPKLNPQEYLPIIEYLEEKRYLLDKQEDLFFSETSFDEEYLRVFFDDILNQEEFSTLENICKKTNRSFY